MLLVGEGYWVLTNADRELVARKAQTAPIADAQRARNIAEKRLADAKKAKTDADKTAADEAAKPGCKAHCASMLLAAQNSANAELAAARAAYAAAKIPESATALAANLGIEQWQWDLFIAALRSGMIAAGALAHRYPPGQEDENSGSPADGYSQGSSDPRDFSGGDDAGPAHEPARARLPIPQCRDPAG